MSVQNADIAAALSEIADLLDIEAANPFRIRACRNAARTISEAGRSVSAMVAQTADSLLACLAAVPGVARAVAAGSLRRRRETVGDLDLLVIASADSAVPAQSFGAAWVYFTGSKAHNIALRRLAQEQGLKINEYGCSGALRLPDSILQRLDLVVEAVHRHLELPRARQNERVLRARWPGRKACWSAVLNARELQQLRPLLARRVR